MSTDTVPQAAMSPRDVWLTVALAVAKGEIAHPDAFEVRPDIKSVDLTYNARIGNPLAEQQAEQAAAFFRLGDPSRAETRAIWWDMRSDGWSWNVRAYWPEPAAPTPLSDHVVKEIGAQLRSGQQDVDSDESRGTECADCPEWHPIDEPHNAEVTP